MQNTSITLYFTVIGDLLGAIRSWGEWPSVFRELGSKVVILGSWGARSEYDFLTCFYFIGREEVGMVGAQIPLLHINITIPFNPLAKTDLWLTFRCHGEHFRLSSG